MSSPFPEARDHPPTSPVSIQDSDSDGECRCEFCLRGQTDDAIQIPQPIRPVQLLPPDGAQPFLPPFPENVAMTQRSRRFQDFEADAGAAARRRIVERMRARLPFFLDAHMIAAARERRALEGPSPPVSSPLGENGWGVFPLPLPLTPHSSASTCSGCAKSATTTTSLLQAPQSFGAGA
uniref:Uncharacterized protein n=1 Tax=Chromera velia CCMP2878 TaxID=1169474 RepID=A0A0G4I9Z4_9ALVE|eukprot:Cvel_12399.t1-p1 / transcript=Cvel_12399.t1 / gene=Cvel_12399 / organism=Chromera_velia_CCMP2878 / gene_product=hypothetical protein / transcript_product=hypothetical protein / location=Cvel_scaffold810:31910-32831(-) / protein_length=178 / sequence_SO=supercontig / SO=protein_coding / is_pseudo=false